MCFPISRCENQPMSQRFNDSMDQFLDLAVHRPQRYQDLLMFHAVARVALLDARGQPGKRLGLRQLRAEKLLHVLLRHAKQALHLAAFGVERALQPHLGQTQQSVTEGQQEQHSRPPPHRQVRKIFRHHLAAAPIATPTATPMATCSERRASRPRKVPRAARNSALYRLCCSTNILSFAASAWLRLATEPFNCSMAASSASARAWQLESWRVWMPLSARQASSATSAASTLRAPEALSASAGLCRGGLCPPAAVSGGADIAPFAMSAAFAKPSPLRGKRVGAPAAG